MTSYNNFIGIDIGKESFFVNLFGHKEVEEFDNTSAGIDEFILKYTSLLNEGYCVMETTGGYEMPLLYSLCEKEYACHRADTRKVKFFIRSLGTQAKTDRLDAMALANYGKIHHLDLALFQPASAQSIELFKLTQRRQDLKQMIVAEKNRLSNSCSDTIDNMLNQVIELLNKQIGQVTNMINEIIENDDKLKKYKVCLMEIPGIGAVVANELLALLPELGNINRKKIAALCGLAPIAYESGKYKGYRKTCHGRKGIKPMLFLAAMAARNSKSQLAEFYHKLVNNGKKKMVALTALMRKIIVIANAKIKYLNLKLEHS